MSKVYFIKELVNNAVTYSGGEKFPHKKDGENIPFTHGADDYGHLMLDTDTDGHEIAEIRFLIKNRRGGIIEVDQARYDEEKKILPSTKIGSSKQGMPRLAEQRFDPFRAPANPGQRASAAGVLVNAGGVAGRSAEPATAPVNGLPSSQVAPPAQTFSPRVGKAGKGKGK